MHKSIVKVENQFDIIFIKTYIYEKFYGFTIMFSITTTSRVSEYTDHHHMHHASGETGDVHVRII